MKKHKVAYIDEDSSDTRDFQRHVHSTLDYSYPQSQDQKVTKISDIDRGY
jgi:hypothetical protein